MSEQFAIQALGVIDLSGLMQRHCARGLREVAKVTPRARPLHRGSARSNAL